MSSSFARVITVEPAFFIYFTARTIIENANGDLNFQKRCDSSGQISEPEFSTSCDGHAEVIEIPWFYSFITVSLCACYSVFATLWSDTAGRRRRPLIFLPIVGIILQAIFGCLHSHFWYWDPFYATVSNDVAEIVTGGMGLIIFGTQLYICDRSSIESRTMRIGILLAFGTLGKLVGSSAREFLLRNLGYYYTYLVCLKLSIICLVMAVVFIKDTSVVPVQRKSVCGGISTFFRKDLGGKGIVVIMLLIIYTMVFFTTDGGDLILEAYVRFFKFPWFDYILIEYYVPYRFICFIIGTIFCSVVLSKRFQVHDSLIGLLTAAIHTIAVLGYIFAYKSWHAYVVTLFDLYGAITPVTFSFLSKFYENDELGHLCAVLGVCDLISSVSSRAIPFQAIFDAPFKAYPLVIWLSSFLPNTITALLFCFVYLRIRRLQPRGQVPELTIIQGGGPMTLQK